MAPRLRAPLYWIGQVALWVVVTALSGFDYFRRFNLVLNSRIADLPLPRAAAKCRKHVRQA